MKAEHFEHLIMIANQNEDYELQMKLMNLKEQYTGYEDASDIISRLKL